MLGLNFSGKGAFWLGRDRRELASVERIEGLSKMYTDEEFRVSVGVKPFGTRINSKLSSTLFSHLLLSDKVLYLETLEGFYIYFFSIYSSQTVGIEGRALIDISERAFQQYFLEVVSDDDSYDLSSREAEWFTLVLNELLGEVSLASSDGTSSFIKGDFSNLEDYMRRIYKVNFYSSITGNGIEINFIENRRNTMYIDPGKLAITFFNYLNDVDYKVDLF